MDKSVIDMEVLDYLLDTVKNWVINDVIEDKTRDWRYLLALSESKKILKENYDLDTKVEEFSSEMMDLVIKEFENNISTIN